MMKNLCFFLLLFSFSLRASELMRACDSCPKEAYIHLASGFFSTFNEQKGELVSLTPAPTFDVETVVALIAKPLDKEEASFSLRLRSFSSEDRELSYRVNGAIVVDGESTDQMKRHYYYPISQNEVLYAIEGQNTLILGDVINPTDSHPIFRGVLIRQGKITHHLSIKGLDFDDSDRMLQRMERFMYRR